MRTSWIEWVEPYGPNNEPVYLRVRIETAIAQRKAFAALKGHVYKSDAEALEDFITVNWGRRIELDT